MATGRLPDPNSSPLTAKGDLYTYSTVPAKLAVGNNGETLVADSSATTGLRWQGNYAAGKNAIINGDFRINQRNFSSTTTSGDFGFDRFKFVCAGGTSTMSAQTFTAGTAPVAGYEGKNFVRLVSTGQSATSDRTTIQQFIESVRTFAGQTVTVSFWAKASTGTPNIAVELAQSFGSGGSPSATVTAIGATKLAITSSWVRYSVTASVPSISGKTLGTTDDGSLNLILWTSAGTDFNARTGSLGLQSVTIDFWGVQVESGSVATPFQTATGTLAGELAACQRYAVKIGGNANYNQIGCGNFNSAGTVARAIINLPVEMRTAPSSITSASLRAQDTSSGFTMSSVALDTASSKTVAFISGTVSGATAFRFCFIDGDTGAGYVILSAEL